MTPQENSIRLFQESRDRALEQMTGDQPKHVRLALINHVRSMECQIQNVVEFQRTKMAEFFESDAIKLTSK